MIAAPDDQVWRLEGRWLAMPGRARYRMYVIGVLLGAVVFVVLTPLCVAAWVWAGLGPFTVVAAPATAALLAGTVAQTVCSALSRHYTPTTRLDYWVDQAVKMARTPRPGAPAVERDMSLAPAAVRRGERVVAVALPDHLRRTPYDCDLACPGRADTPAPARPGVPDAAA